MYQTEIKAITKGVAKVQRKVEKFEKEFGRPLTRAEYLAAQSCWRCGPATECTCDE